MGSNVCGTHGGMVPVVRAAAATRIGMSVEDAVKRLHTMLDDPGVDAREKVKILHDMLDRGGLNATSKHLVGHVSDDPVEALFRDILSHPDALAAPTDGGHGPEGGGSGTTVAVVEEDEDEEDLIGLPAPDSEDIVDAELVEDDEPRIRTNRVRPPKSLRDDLERLKLL